MAVGTNARAHKRHSSFLDEKVYDDMSRGFNLEVQQLVKSWY